MADEDQKNSRKPDEDPVGKVYDSRLIRRLAHYLRPYWVQATVSALAVSLKSLSDVTGPYLVKVAIDRYLTGTARPGHQLAHPPPSRRPLPRHHRLWPPSIWARCSAPISSSSSRPT